MFLALPEFRRLDRGQVKGRLVAIGRGRKGLYHDWLTPDNLTLLEGWARDGLTDQDISDKIGINVSTLYAWEKDHSEIREAIKKGKAPVDIKVENALLKRALGYDYEEIVTEIEIVPGRTDANGKPIEKKHIRKTTKHIPPETAAGIFWLKNRRPDKWRDKIEQLPEPEKNELLQSLLDLERNYRK